MPRLVGEPDPTLAVADALSVPARAEQAQRGLDGLLDAVALVAQLGKVLLLLKVPRARGPQRLELRGVLLQPVGRGYRLVEGFELALGGALALEDVPEPVQQIQLAGPLIDPVGSVLAFGDLGVRTRPAGRGGPRRRTLSASPRRGRAGLLRVRREGGWRARRPGASVRAPAVASADSPSRVPPSVAGRRCWRRRAARVLRPGSSPPCCRGRSGPQRTRHGRGPRRRRRGLFAGPLVWRALRRGALRPALFVENRSALSASSPHQVRRDDLRKVRATRRGARRAPVHENGDCRAEVGNRRASP